MSNVRVPKEEQAAYALKHCKVANLSILPLDWHPETHYSDESPMTSTYPLKDRSEFMEEDGTWIVSTNTDYVNVDTPNGSPRPSLELLSYKNLLIWEDDRIGARMTLDEEKVGAIKSEWVQPLLVKLIKTVKHDRERIESLEQEVSSLRGDPKRMRQSMGERE